MKAKFDENKTSVIFFDENTRLWCKKDNSIKQLPDRKK
jgi:hypothetical protein